MKYTLENFDEFAQALLNRIERLEKILTEREPIKEELIDRKELCKRLSVSAPTIIKMEKKGQLPSSRKGRRVFYDYNKVKEALEK